MTGALLHCMRCVCARDAGHVAERLLGAVRAIPTRMSREGMRFRTFGALAGDGSGAGVVVVGRLWRAGDPHVVGR